MPRNEYGSAARHLPRRDRKEGAVRRRDHVEIDGTDHLESLRFLKQVVANPAAAIARSIGTIIVRCR